MNFPSESTSSTWISPLALEVVIKSAKEYVEDSSSMVRLRFRARVGVRRDGVPDRVLCEEEPVIVGVKFNLFLKRNKLVHEYNYKINKIWG